MNLPPNELHPRPQGEPPSPLVKLTAVISAFGVILAEVIQGASAETIVITSGALVLLLRWLHDDNNTAGGSPVIRR